MQNAYISEQTPQSPMNTYRPSVPISVYKELSAELQAAQAMLDSLNSQNQQLAKENQQLRQEIEKVVQSALHAQQLVTSFSSGGRVEAPPPAIEPEIRTAPSASTPKRRPPQPPPLKGEPALLTEFSESLVIEQEEGRYRRPTQPERSPDVSGWWLIVVISLIVATAFGTGFLIVRPLLNNSR
ncbi:hypothetical protein H6H02_12630 [Coleofasciculus sp. FACHB-1120]|nr:hypothetical protein [Coleofasciculus sp. FACHB-1120]